MGKKISIEGRASYSDELKMDAEVGNFSRQVYDAHGSYVDTRIPSNPQWVHLNPDLLKELGWEDMDQEELLQLVSGTKRWGDQRPFAMAYGGHQFGNWAGQLGDGRATNMAEIVKDNKRYAFQLKGAGPTPYSRGSDGLAVLRSSIREYLCSEAMHHLGISTTRALSLVTTGDDVLRDVMYNGNPAYEPGAVACRISSSFIRFGSFEIHTSRKEEERIKALADYTIKYFYPHLGSPTKETYLTWFSEVAQRTGEMIIHWQRVGFVHGVMNTDNMSILGQTIDYGPYGWLDNFERDWTPNTTDAQHKRYRYGNQPSMALWNLTQLANAIYPLIQEVEPLQKALNDFKTKFERVYNQMNLSKLGIVDSTDENLNLVKNLFPMMERSQMDMTIFFRKLADFKENDQDKFMENLSQSSYLNTAQFEVFKKSWATWLAQYAESLKKEGRDPVARKQAMNLTNPKYVLRNYMAQVAIEASEKGDHAIVDELFQLLKRPYDEQPAMEKWFAKRPDWALNKVGCSMLSCSS